MCGLIDQVGDQVTGYQVGEKIAVANVIPCGNCFSCLSGRENACMNRTARFLPAVGVWLADNHLSCAGDIGQLYVHQTDRAGAHNQDSVIKAGSRVFQAADTAGERLDQSTCGEGDGVWQLDQITGPDTGYPPWSTPP